MLFDHRSLSPRRLFDDPDRGAWIDYVPRFMRIETADRVLAELLEKLPFENERPVIMGKVFEVARKSCAYGDEGLAYRYSGVSKNALPWVEPLVLVRGHAEKRADCRYNFVLCNLYPDGAAGLGWHADSERDLVKGAPIASVSLGEERTFQVRSRASKAVVLSQTLEHGSLLLMGGTLQEHYEHQVPKRANVSKPRVNLTFRQVAR